MTVVAPGKSVFLSPGTHICYQSPSVVENADNTDNNTWHTKLDWVACRDLMLEFQTARPMA